MALLLAYGAASALVLGDARASAGAPTSRPGLDATGPARDGAVDEDDLSYYSGEFLQDILEVTLLELGGPELLADAHDEAGAYVDEHYPWSRALPLERSG